MKFEHEHLDDTISWSQFTYRKGHEGDIPEILHVIQSAFAEYQGKLDPPSNAPQIYRHHHF